jgi:hypothetical protein
MTRKDAAIAQIHAAIKHFHEGEIECAITLALTAEGQIPNTDEPHLFRILKKQAHLEADAFNFVRNWLKHCTGPEKIVIEPSHALYALVRAISKYHASYSETTGLTEDFVEFVRRSGIGQ